MPQIGSVEQITCPLHGFRIILTAIPLFGRSFSDYSVSILPTGATINRVAGGTEGRLSWSGGQRPLAALVHQPIMYGIADQLCIVLHSHFSQKARAVGADGLNP